MVTSKLGLDTFANSDTINVTTQLSEQLRILDAHMDVVTCTSVLRPTNRLYNNKLAYETDTGNLIIYKSATHDWVVFSHGKKPLGQLAFVSTTSLSSSVNGTNEIGPYLTITFAAVLGRRYALHFSGSLENATGNFTTGKFLRIRLQAGGPVTTSSSQFFRIESDVDDNNTGLSVRQHLSFPWTPSVAGIYTAGVFLQSTAGSNQVRFNSGNYHVFAVEDIGKV